MTIAQLAGGAEPDRTAALPTPIDVSEDCLREVLGTGLFSARGGDLGWAHQTYGEYLAAAYLASSESAPSQLATLLVADAGDGRIVPQLRDVARWSAAMDMRIMDELAANDPLVLLRGDMSSADDVRKARLTEALLHERVAQELDRWDGRTRRNLAGLAHPGLAAALRRRFVDAEEPLPVRELACLLVGLCEVDQTRDTLLDLALSSDQPLSLRVAAVRALQVVADAETLLQLLPLARDALPEDADDALKGSVLRAICPSVVSAAEALGYVTPQKNQHLFGAYAGFLSRDLLQALTDEELPAALRWVRRLPYPHDPMDDLGSLAEKILVRGMASIARDEVRAPLVEVVADYLRNHHDLQSFRTRERTDAFSAEDNRHALLEALLPMMRDGQLDPIAVVVSTPRLITAGDLPWLVERLGQAVGGTDETTWAELIDSSAGVESADHELVMMARESSPVLHDLTRFAYGPVERDSDLAAGMKSAYERAQQSAREDAARAADIPDFDANIELLLDRFEAGDLDAFWILSRHIWGEPGQAYVTEGGSDLTSAPGWRRADPARRARIALAANVYLRDYPPSRDWLDPGTRYHPATAGYRALRYAMEHDPESLTGLPTDTICGWVPAIVTFVHDGGEDDEQAVRTRLLEVVATRCPDALTSVAREWILAEAAHGAGHLFALDVLRPVLRGDLAAQLLELWRSEDLRELPHSRLFDALLRAGVGGAAEAGLHTLTSELIESDRTRARLLATSLLGSGGRRSWERLWPLIIENPAWGGEVFESVACDWERAGDFRAQLSESELGDVFIWLSEQFPPDEDPDRLGTHFVGPREQVAEYRDRILSLLVDRATTDALRTLERIEGATGRDLPHVRIRAEEAWRINSWIPARPEDVIRLATDPQRRVVLSEGHLQKVVVESLGRIQMMLADEGQAHQVWDTSAGRPKGETEVAAWIAHRLRDDLRGRGIVINREVEVRVNPRGGVGDRTDIHIDAIAGARVEGAQQLTLVVEVKGCWHAKLRSAMRSQLSDDYLSPARRHGIYLAVLFGPSGWRAEEDPRRRRCAKVDRDALASELTAQAVALRAEGYEIAVVILDASLT